LISFYSSEELSFSEINVLNFFHEEKERSKTISFSVLLRLILLQGASTKKSNNIL